MEDERFGSDRSFFCLKIIKAPKQITSIVIERQMAAFFRFNQTIFALPDQKTFPSG